MLEKMGWKKGEGLGKGGTGMKTPVRAPYSLELSNCNICFNIDVLQNSEDIWFSFFFFLIPFSTDWTENQEVSVGSGSRCSHVSRQRLHDQVKVPEELGESQREICWYVRAWRIGRQNTEQLPQSLGESRRDGDHQLTDRRPKLGRRCIYVLWTLTAECCFTQFVL